MAASIDFTQKLSKAERKALKKQLRSQHTLFKHENLTTSKGLTEHLVVANGGLDNNIQREEMWKIFSQHGTIVNITMQTKKPYCFVSYSTKQGAAEAMRHVHGRMLSCPEELSRPGVTFYLSYVEDVPGCEVPKTSLPPGLKLLKDYISEDEEQRLLSCVSTENEDCPNDNVPHATLKHRKVRHYGYEFVYGLNNINPNTPLPQGIPEECDAVLDRLVCEGHISAKPDQLTVNQYSPGQGIPPHIDTHSACEDCILSVSLGSQVVMDFRHPDGRHVPVLLPQRSVLVMTGESRYVWTHGITPRKSDIIPVTSHLDRDDDETTAKTLSCSAEQEEISPADFPKQEMHELTLVKRGVRTSLTFRKVLRESCDCKYIKQCDSQQSVRRLVETRESDVMLPGTDEEAVLLERLHVHDVYEDIADHFSDTRHKAWPRVAAFLDRQNMAAIVADIGCGNGKYLGVNTATYSVGCDRSTNLCEICKARGFPVFVADVLSVPLRDESCDVAISIAVLHHLATVERRRRAVEEMVRVLRAGGQALISVWALEQELNNQPSNYLQKSRTTKAANSIHENIAEESDSDLHVVEPKKKLTIHVNRTQFAGQDLLVPWHKKNQNNRPNSKISSMNGCDNKCDSNDEPIYHRFYHVFQKGELEELVLSVSSTRIVESYYDKGNWCVIYEKGS